MADITVSNSAGDDSTVTLAAGEYISIKILNSDLSVKSTVVEKQCPTGKTFTGIARYDGTLDDV